MHTKNNADYFPVPEGYREEYTGRWVLPDFSALGGSAYKDVGGYFGMVKRLDEALGRILEDTIVVFTSDHGNHFKTRNSEYKRSCHESSIHIPAGMAGCSILPLLRKEAVEWQDDIFVQISKSQVGRAVRTHRWKYSVKAEDKDAWEDASSGHYREEFLYNLKADPYELVNLAGIESHRKVADVMKSRLIRRMELAGEEKPVIYDSEVKIDSEKRRVSFNELYE